MSEQTVELLTVNGTKVADTSIVFDPSTVDLGNEIITADEDIRAYVEYLRKAYKTGLARTLYAASDVVCMKFVSPDGGTHRLTVHGD